MAYRFITIPIYDYPVVLATSLKDAAKALQQQYGSVITLADAKEVVERASPAGAASGWVNEIANDDEQVVCGIMVCDRKRELNTVAHEATHLAMNVLSFAEIETSPDNHEALAYLVGYVTEQFTEKWD